MPKRRQQVRLADAESTIEIDPGLLRSGRGRETQPGPQRPLSPRLSEDLTALHQYGEGFGLTGFAGIRAVGAEPDAGEPGWRLTLRPQTVRTDLRPPLGK